jgi:quercetin dioxygenase-like cupin family protein
MECGNHIYRWKHLRLKNNKPIKRENETMYKNINKQEKLELKNVVEYQEGQVVSKTLVQNDYVSMTIFAFDKGEEISTHAAGGDAMVTVLEGKGKFTVGGEVFFLEAGETLIMPKDIPHAVYGEEKFKMQLVVSY